MTDNTEITSAGRLLASRRHTITLIVILLAIAAAGFAQARAMAHATAGSAVAPSGLYVYLGLLAVELGLFAYVRMGLRKAGTRLGDVISPRGWSFGGLLIDAILGCALFALWLGFEFAWSRVSGTAESAAVQSLQVHNAAYVPVWILLSISAGFVEELTFRGYLQQQFGALLRNPVIALVLQAVLFGITHGYQGVEPVIRITLFGLLFGAFAALRKSIRPGMVAHTLVDVAGGLMH